MQTELAQIISLTSYGNEFIRTSNIAENYSENTVFQGCNKISFNDFKKSLWSSKLVGKIVADNPLDWFKLLKKEGCCMIRLNYIPSIDRTFGPEYMQAGFVGGGGKWLIETNFGEYSHFWHKRWEVTNKAAIDRNIWGVNYDRTIAKFKPIDQQIDVIQIEAKFENTLIALVAFCKQQEMNNWLGIFEKAQKVLHDSAPNNDYYHYDLIVLKNYPLVSQQLLFSAATAWVFGGMGSWNDMGFEDKSVQETYLNLSQQLYEQLLQSIIASVNSY